MIARMRKALVAVLGLAAIAATELPPNAPEALQRWAPVVIGVATVLGVYGVRNQPLATPAAPVTTPNEGTAHIVGPDPGRVGQSRVGQVFDQTQQPPTR